MKHFFYLFLTLVSSQYAYANMAEPYIQGSSHNALYSSSHCDVIGEKIKIVIHEKQDVDHKLFGVFQICYNIHAESDQKIPLLFIGKGLSDAKKIIVNQFRVVPRLLDSQSVKQYAFITRAPEGSYYYAQYNADQKLPVNLDELIYFEAVIKKGDNQVYIEYEADFGYSVFGFLDNFQINYSLYPCQFWRSFGPIDLELDLNNLAELSGSNLGRATMQRQTVKWTIHQISQDINITVNYRMSWFAKVLLWLQPIGLTIVVLLAIVWWHIHWIIGCKRKGLLFWLGIFIVPLIGFVVFFSAYSLIDFFLQKQSKHGYVLLLVIYYPFVVLTYGIALGVFKMTIIDKYKAK